MYLPEDRVKGLVLPFSAGIFKQSIGARNHVRIVYGAPESIPRNEFRQRM
jgi:hypothetical protein